MRLLTAIASPFGRKVSMVARELNLQLTEENVDAQVSEEVHAHNPLRQIPVLVLSDGSAVYDSDVICRVLNDYVGGDLYPKDAERGALTRLALADGLAETSVALNNIYRLPEAEQSATLMERYRARIARVLDHMDATIEALSNPVVSIDKIATAAAVGHVDLRHGAAWRDGRPGLSRWIDRVAERPSMADTRHPDGRF
ncbi:MAG: glutathione S-transferase family protein [Azospirillaceae bacterium]